ncbi:hypothetical protein HDU77_002108 [Chytriomyces hyalinus]|nr:hypothetical protein HDU77_002108 [Chytriomyces hyalinus]
MKEKAKAEKAGTLYVAKDVDDLHAWLETTYGLCDSKVTITNLHTLIEQVKSRGYVNLLSYQSEFKDIVSRMSSSAKPDSHTLIKLFLQGCLPDDQKELVKYSIDSSRVPVTDFNKFLDHVDTQDSHNQMLDQVASGLSVRENVFLHMVTPPVAPEPEPIPVAPVLPAVPAVNIDNLTAEFSKMALHVTSGKALDMYQLSHAQSEEFKALCLVFRGPAVVSSPASSNISKGVVTVTNDRGFERRKFDITKSKSLSDSGLLQYSRLETGEMWRMKDGKSIYELLKEKVEAGSVSMSTGKVRIGGSTVLVVSEVVSCAFHPVVLDKSNVQYLDIGDGEYHLLTDVIGVLVGEAVTEKEAWDAWAELEATLIPLPQLPKLANYPKIHLPATCPDPTPPKTVPQVPKPSAKYQYKKSNEMASVDLDKRTVEILTATKIELSCTPVSTACMQTFRI